MYKKHWLKYLSVLLALLLVLVACGGGEEPAPTEAPVQETEPEEVEEAEPEPEVEEEAEAEPEAEEEMEEEAMDGGVIAAGGAGFIDRALAGEFAGTTVTMLGPVTDEDEVKLNATVVEFEAATGIDLVYEGTKEFEAIVTTRVEGGDAPDIVDFPQPGLLANFVRAGHVIDLNDHFDSSYMQGQYIQSWLDMATIEGEMAGLWHRVFGKSQVWYPKDDWEAAGYPIPETWDELVEVMDMIVSDGDAPWCIGIESGAATGWAATDWTEEMMLRTTSLENYDAWVAGELPFDSPEVRGAIEAWADIWFNDDYVFGGREQIATTFFGDSPAAMFEDPPQCWMHRQGSFITSFFPEGNEAGVDYDFFYLPPVGDDYGSPYLVSGDIYAAFSDRPEVMAMMEYFSRGQSLQVWMESGGALSPHKDVDLSWHSDPVEAGVGSAIAAATSVRFDASDLMPGEVGAGTFWTGMTSYVNGDADLDTILAEIDASWPTGIAGESGSEIEGDDDGEIMAEGSFMERAMAGEFDGTTVTMLGPVTDEDEVKLNATVAEFEAATGIDLVYEGTKEFEAIVTTRVEGGDAPDIVDFPQPGLLANFVRAGHTVDLNDHLAPGYLEGQYIQSWLDMATIEGEMAGIWHRVFGKSQVWYPKDDWEAAGYPIPENWEELVAVMDMIVADGDTPWCIGIESGAATGWAATDWTEEMMLRTTSLENYDAWVAGELPFSSPEVQAAIEAWSDIWFNDDYVFGGREQIATTFFGDSPAAMFEDPPQCWMHRQGSFITSFFPEGNEAGVDYDFFYLPPIGDNYGRPYLVSGDLYAAFSDRPEVMAFMEYFATGESLKVWMESGGALSPHKDVDLSWHSDPVEAGVGAAIAAATSVRFDASDLMPGEVGAGSFWTGMTSYVNGDSDLETILAEIDASWPAGIAGESGAEIEGGSAETPGFVERALAGEFEGTTVTMLGPVTDEDEVKLNATVAEFAEATGINFVYEGTKEFEAIVTTRIEGGDSPDIIDFPQPGLLNNFVQAGAIVDLNDHFSREYLEQQYIESWLDMADMDGTTAGIWHRVFGKSQVWYPKDDWEAAGYPIPETHDELIAVMDMIVADGDTPWCIGIESGAATGWAATDWTEEMMLRTTSLENYDAWVAGELPFSSPEVQAAIEAWSDIWFNDDYVFGGREQIATTFFGDSPAAMFEDPPQCWMHKQGSFITSFFPEGNEAGVDYDFFYLPPIGDELGRPYLVSGDIYAATSDRPEVLAFMEYFTLGESLKVWMESGGALSPHKDVDLSWHSDPVEAGVGAAIAAATSVRFDASDLMPGEVGAGTFWTGMTSYVNGDADLETILAEIDASWP